MNIEKISYYLLLVVVITLPLFAKLTPITIVIFSILTIVNGFKNKSFNIENKKVFYFGLSFFLIHLISVFYSEHKDVAWFDIEVKLSLFVFPLLFIVKNRYLSRSNILFLFSMATFIALVYMLTMAMNNYSELGYKSFEYTNLSRYMHPTYISMYTLFSLVYLLNLFLENYGRNAKYYLLLLPIIIFIISIYLFQSKAGYISFFLVLLYFTIKYIFNSKNIIIKILLPLVIILFSVLSYFNSYRVRDMIGVVNQIVLTGDSRNTTTGIRFEIWKATCKIIPDNFVFGVGAGDIKPELNVKYNENAEFLSLAKKENLNVHNQYLETFLGQGVIGFLLLIFLLVFGALQAFKVKDSVFISFMILIIVNFFPESMLNTQSGVVFFSVFFYLLSGTEYKKYSLNI